MKCIRAAIVALLFSAVMAFALIPSVDPNAVVTAHADTDVTITGTVSSDSTNSVLKLDTDAGVYSLKIDSDSDFGGHKFLIQGQKITCVIYRGSDAYMHLRSISDSVITTASNGDVIVTGTVKSDTTSSILSMETSDGVMKVKIDDDTVFSNVRILVSGEKINVAVHRGSDAYMHASQVMPYGSTTTSSSSGSSSSSSSSSSSTSTTAIKGTATSSSDGILTLTTTDGTMLLKVDSSAEDKVYLKGNSLKLSVYRGNDGYMHASAVENQDGSIMPTSSLGSSFTVSGKVSSSTCSGMLYLSTSDGDMKIAIDSDTSVTAGRVLTKDEKVTVTAARGTDGYNHCITIK